jgi:hypothetical protein
MRSEKKYQGYGQVVTVIPDGDTSASYVLEKRRDVSAVSREMCAGAGRDDGIQLAVALLCDHLGKDWEASVPLLARDFYTKLVAQMPYDGWSLTTKNLDWTLDQMFEEMMQAGKDDHHELWLEVARRLDAVGVNSMLAKRGAVV